MPISDPVRNNIYLLDLVIETPSPVVSYLRGDSRVQHPPLREKKNSYLMLNEYFIKGFLIIRPLTPQEVIEDTLLLTGMISNFVTPKRFKIYLKSREIWLFRWFIIGYYHDWK